LYANPKFKHRKREDQTLHDDSTRVKTLAAQASQIEPEDYVPDDIPDKLLWYYLPDDPSVGPYYAVAKGRRCGIYTDM